MKRMVRWAFASLVTLGVIGAFAPAASAHPSDELLQQLYVTPATSGVQIEIDLTPGVLIAPAFVGLIDGNGDGSLLPNERSSYAAAVAKALVVSIDGAGVAVRVLTTDYPDAAILGAGGGPIKIELAADVAVAGTDHTVTVTNSYSPLRTTVQGAATIPSDHAVEVGAVEHSPDGVALTVHYRTTSASGVAPTTVTTVAGSGVILGAPAKSRLMFAALQRPLGSAWGLITLLAASLLLGALHALTPGHGKTLLAAYLVGDRGTPKQAVALGTAVTVTHTASVVAIGAAVLLAGRYIVPGVLVPALEVGSGLLVVVLGIRLLGRGLARGGSAAGHDHSHDHHDHDHHHSHHNHDPDHSHDVPESLGWRSLITMGVSGGIVPCPEALGVLILAVGVHRTALGLCMIIAFSTGLALVLVGLGLILVSARTSRWMRDRAHTKTRLWHLVPLGSAAVVTTLGVVMALRGISTLAH
jgi:nickel/cobalt transporter (NicO) family protein